MVSQLTWSHTQTFVDPYGLKVISIIRNLPVPPDILERLYAWIIARIVDAQFVKVTFTYDVKCPKGSSRHLLSETDEYIEIRNEITLNVANIDVSSFQIYKPKKHVVTKTYGCCHDCSGFNTKGWNKTKEEKFTDLGGESFDWEIISGEITVKEHSVLKKRWRECKQSIEPIRTWTDVDSPNRP